MKVLVTGAAGFIGYPVCRRLTEAAGCYVVGLDNLDPAGDVALKRARLAELAERENFRFVRADLCDAEAVRGLLTYLRPDYVVHLAARAGVRESANDPHAYVAANITGWLNLLEASRAHPPRHIVYASSSTVYGREAALPWREDAATDTPVSVYGATKKSSELLAATYAHLHGLRLTGLRFFSVYGPWGRPDMAPLLFTRAILAGEPIRLFNAGENRRDFTYIDDVVGAVVKVLLYPPPSPPTGAAANAAAMAPSPEDRARILNVGHGRPVEVRLLVRMLEELLGRAAVIEALPARADDLPETWADLARIREAIGYTPNIPLEEGLRRMVAWWREHAGATAPA